jgi:hypothetical protein
MSPTLIIPTLKHGKSQLLKTPPAITQGIVEFFFMNPGDISTHFPNLVSFRVLEAQYETDPANLANMVSMQLEAALRSLLPSLNPTVETTRINDTVNKYTLRIKITDNVGVALLYGQNIDITSGGGIDFRELTEDEL